MPNAIYFALGCSSVGSDRLFKWSPTFTGCFDPKPWHPPVGGSAVVASLLLGGSRLPAQIVSVVPRQQDGRSAGSPIFLIAVLHALPDTAASTRIVMRTLCSRPPLEKTKFVILAVFHWVCIFKALPLMCLFTIFRSALLRPTSLTAKTLGMRLVLDWFPRCCREISLCTAYGLL